MPIHILGGGSNILLTKDLSGYVIKNEIKGISIVSESELEVIVEVGAGEKWHQFVMWSLSHDLGGIENLALIPGTVGAAPMQNIGAYGIEQDTCFDSLSAVRLTDGSQVVFDRAACKFGYRESVFKNDEKNKFFITRVRYKLAKKSHILHTSYGAIKDVLDAKCNENPTIQDVAQAVMDIRMSKLPDPSKIGNAGSFFKNPIVTTSQFDKIKHQYPEMPAYKVSDDEIKIPAGWLIEKAGFKGKTYGNIGVHKDQALVLVNYGGGTGEDIKKLANEIQKRVLDQFGIEISPEVNFW